MALISSLEKSGLNPLPSLDALKANVGPKKGGDKFVEMVEKKWGPIAGLGAAALMDYMGFGKEEKKDIPLSDTEQKDEVTKDDTKEKDKKKRPKSALAKLKDKVSEKKKEIKDKVEDKKPEKSEIDKKLEVKSGKMTVTEDIELTNKIESMEANDRVMFAMMLAREKFQTGGMHCWDWMDKIYTSVGCGRKTIYRNVDYKGQDCRVVPHAIIENGKVKLPKGNYIELKPGDHISINNRNKADKSDKRGGGNHSVAFLGWASDGVAKVVGYDAKSNTSLAYNVNLNKQPIVHISRPVAKKPVNLAMLEFHLRQEPAKIKGKMPERIV